MFLLSFILVPPILAQGTTGTQTSNNDDQATLTAPAWNGETGLFNTVTATTLQRGDFSFSVYAQNYRLLAGPAQAFALPSARRYRDYGYDLDRYSVSGGYGLTDHWEVSAAIPFDKIHGDGGDRAGFINGWLYQGRFSDGGVGDVHLATKYGLTPSGSRSTFALSLFTDLPTGSKDSGISAGSGRYGLGVHWTAGMASLAASYAIVGQRSRSDSNFPPSAPASVKLPNEIDVDGGLNIPQRWWHATNWVSEVNGTFYTGGDVKPKAPIFLVSGLRHWFGDSGWSINGAIRFNVAKFSYDKSVCSFTELSDCSLAGLVGITFSPTHAAHLAPPPPPPPAAVPPPPPPPPPEPVPVVPPPAPPVTPPPVPSEMRTDTIHFESGSARLTNIAKAILDDVALRMKQEPASTAQVIGYTDGREATGANADLDVRRAQAVKDYLVSRHGIDASRISVEGRDAREPAGDDATATGRAENRRVVIRLVLP